MSVTININGLSLVHKGSSGTATATIPDVCNTPSPTGPIPLPYPNIAMSKTWRRGPPPSRSTAAIWPPIKTPSCRSAPATKRAAPAD
jgi:hypothetical protein